VTATTHTPGPWRYVRTNPNPTHGEHMISGAKPGFLAEVRDCGSCDVHANARLIAAAPLMVDALRTLVREWDCGRNPIARDWAAARAALAAAENT